MNRNDARQSILNFLWLLIGCAFLLFMGGKWNIPAATWIGSIFFVRYFRRIRTGWGILLALPFLLVTSHVFFIGLAEQVDAEFKVIIAVSYTLYVMVPCLADRLLYRRIGSPLLSTLAYPAALITVQFLLSYIEQLGTVLHWTGSLFSMQSLLQLVSVTGVWGPSFLVGWLASAVNTLWEADFDWQKAGRPAAVYAGVFALVCLWGGARMNLLPPAPGTVKVGSVVVGLPADNLSYAYLDLSPDQQAAQKDSTREWTLRVQDELFAESDRLASAGIQILSWASGNAVAFPEDEPALIRRMQAFAGDHQVYFFASMLVLGNYDGPDRNRVMAILPDGRIAYTHFKGRNPNSGYFEGNRIETVDTPYGRIASPICFEMEFHRLIRQAGEKQVDILIVPGDEPSRENSVVHTELSMLRCIENGCSMVRTTLEGQTMGMDYEGRVLSQMNYYRTLEGRSIVSELPTKGVRTLYAQWGDWFAYACIILLAILTGFGIRNGLRRKM